MSLQNWRKWESQDQKNHFNGEVQNILHEGNTSTKMRCNSIA